MPNKTIVAKASLQLVGATTATASYNSAAFTNYWHRGCYLFVNVSARSGTSPTLDAKLQMQDPVSGTWTDVENASIVQMTAVRMNYLYLYPGIIGGDTDGTLVVNTNNKFVEGFLPYIFRVAVTIGGTTPSFTHTISVHFLP